MDFLKLTFKYYSIAFILFIFFGMLSFLNRQSKPKKEIVITEESYISKHGPEPLMKEFNNSYFEVAEYLQQVAVDPDSVKINSCTNAKKTDKGWLVRCKYTAKNKRGEVGAGSNDFYISNNEVVLREK